MNVELKGRKDLPWNETCDCAHWFHPSRLVLPPSLAKSGLLDGAALDLLGFSPRPYLHYLPQAERSSPKRLRCLSLVLNRYILGKSRCSCLTAMYEHTSYEPGSNSHKTSIMDVRLRQYQCKSVVQTDLTREIVFWVVKGLASGWTVQQKQETAEHKVHHIAVESCKGGLFAERLCLMRIGLHQKTAFATCGRHLRSKLDYVIIRRVRSKVVDHFHYCMSKA